MDKKQKTVKKMLPVSINTHDVEFEYAKSILETIVSSEYSEIEAYYTLVSDYLSKLTYKLTREDKDKILVFLNHESRIATYDVSSWKPLKSLLDFLESDEEQINQTHIEILSNFVSASKFVSIQPVLDIAIPVNTVLEPIVFTNHRWHQFIRAIGSLMTLKYQEKDTNLESPETNWKNEILLNLRRMGFAVNDELELIK